MSASKMKPASAANSSRPVAQPKSMSSRLLTMKFMQRAAASNQSSSSSSNSPHTKAEVEILRAAAAAEADKREVALRAHERLGGADAETRWELSYYKQPQRTNGEVKVVGVGYAELTADESDDEHEETGRMAFGGFRRKVEDSKPKYEDSYKSDNSDADSDASSDEAASLARRRSSTTNGSAKKRKPSSDATPAFISSAGAGAIRAKSCHTCSESGHFARDCPQKPSCHNCGKTGHKAVSCPQNSAGKKRKDRVVNMNNVGKKKFKSEQR